MILDHQIKAEMHNRRAWAINKLTKIVHPRHVEQFATILHYAWQENLVEAETLAEYLDLDPIDFCAITDDAEQFKELLLLEIENSNEEKYA